MLHQLNNLTITDLLTQLGEWSIRNFGEKQASDLGVVEEVGEACHGLLKHYQGIRGFDDPVKYREHMADAFADMGIYLLNYAAVNTVTLSFGNRQSLPLGITDRRACSQILMGCSLLLEFTDTYGHFLPEAATDAKTQLQSILQRIFDWSAMWAEFHEFDYREIVTKTWIKVRQRDWEKNKTHAHIIAEQGGTEVPAATSIAGGTPLTMPPPGFIQAPHDANADGMHPLDIGSATPEPGAIQPSGVPVVVRDSEKGIVGYVDSGVPRL